MNLELKMELTDHAATRFVSVAPLGMITSQRVLSRRGIAADVKIPHLEAVEASNLTAMTIMVARAMKGMK